MEKVFAHYRQTLPLIKKNFLFVLIFVTIMTVLTHFDHDLTSQIGNDPRAENFLPLFILIFLEIFLYVFLYCVFLGKLNRLPIYYVSYFIRYFGYMLKTIFGLLLFIYPGIKWGVGEFFSPEMSIFNEDSELSGPEMSQEVLEDNFQQKALHVLAIVAPQFFVFLGFWAVRINLGESSVLNLLSHLSASIVMVFTISYTYIFLQNTNVKKV